MIATRWAAAIVALALNVSAARAQIAPAPPRGAGEFHISGTVVDANTGAPVVGATVSIAANRAPQPTSTSVTGGDGAFRFDRLTAGKYLLVAERRGYLRESLDQHEAFSTAVAVGPEKVSDGIIFRLHPESTISG